MSVSNYFTKANIFLAAVISLGCHGDSPVTDKNRLKSTPTQRRSTDEMTRVLAERDLEIIRFVLEQLDDPPEGQIYFLTSTPFDKWMKDGTWRRFPKSFHTSIAHLQKKYRPADEAYYRNEFVLERGTDAHAWMAWVTILEWKSNTEVTIEHGVWSGSLVGSGSIVTYEKIDGKWRIKKRVSEWIS